MQKFACVMPLGAPIGSNKGLCTKDFIQILIDEIDLPIIVDAGIGRPSQACEAMEMGQRLLWRIQQSQQQEMSRRWLRHSRKQLKQEEVLIFQGSEERLNVAQVHLHH